MAASPISAEGGFIIPDNLRYEDGMTGDEFDEMLSRLDLSRRQFGQLTGYDMRTSRGWGKLRPPRGEQDVPIACERLIACMIVLSDAGIPWPFDVPVKRSSGRPAPSPVAVQSGLL